MTDQNAVSDFGELADQLEQEQATLGRELEEIDMLLRQATTEAERYEQRRMQAEQKLAAVERDPQPDAGEIGEARAQLISQTRRATLMQAQLDVLKGKQRALERYRDRLAQIIPVVRAGSGRPIIAVGQPEAIPQGQGPVDVMGAQEEMRREIARHMHDGPAQSIANIALQAQIVERLYERDPERAKAELVGLLAMVQQALEATKNFIFDVRPMVLDDLGLMPTLRRSAQERSRRSGTPVNFESVGADGRLPSELESALFRIVDDAVGGFLEVNPIDVLVRLDWSEQAVRATVRARGSGTEQSEEARAHAVVAAARRDRGLPAALASMIREQEDLEAQRNAGLPQRVATEIEQRAAAFGIEIHISPERWQIEAVARR